MLILAATETLAGVAQTAATVTCTAFGMELNGSIETYKALFQSQLPIAAATQYTAPASTSVFVRSIAVVNTSATLTQTFQLFRAGTAQANAVTPLLTLPAGGAAFYEDGHGWTIHDAGGAIVSRINGNLAAAYLSASTANQTSTTEAVISPVLSLPANYLRVGALIEFEITLSVAQGAVAQTTPGHRFAARWGGLAGTIICSVGTITPATALGASPARVRGYIQFLSLGAAAAVRGSIMVTDPRGTRIASGDMVSKIGKSGTGITADTTTAKDFVVTSACTVADASAIVFGECGFSYISLNN